MIIVASHIGNSSIRVWFRIRTPGINTGTVILQSEIKLQSIHKIWISIDITSSGKDLTAIVNIVVSNIISSVYAFKGIIQGRIAPDNIIDKIQMGRINSSNFRITVEGIIAKFKIKYIIKRESHTIL